MKGTDLLRMSPPADWRGDESFLLLNLGISPDWRQRVLSGEFPELPSHAWLATSGTGGVLKLVALSRQALQASANSVNTRLAASPDDAWLNPLPLFHVGGLGIMVRAYLLGARHEIFDRPWNAREFARAAQSMGATLSALVPAQVHDLVIARCRAPRTLRAVVVGGGALADELYEEACALGWPLLPSYGLTEAASQVATLRLGQPGTKWLPLLEHLEVRVQERGILELRGASLMTGFVAFDSDGSCAWEELGPDGWYRTSDRVELRGHDLRILGRIDELVKIRGELIDIAALERALQARVRSGVVLLSCVADDRNGVALQLMVDSDEAAREARDAQDDIFPPYARPQKISIGRIEWTALRKQVRRRIV